MGLHRLAPFSENHVAHSLEFADTASMNAYAATSDDVGRIARKLDDGSFWILQSASPVTWIQMVAPTPPVFGTEFYYAEDRPITTITTTIFTPKVTLGPVSVVGGTYRIEVCYGWNYNSTTRDFIASMYQNGIQLGQWHQQEPKDSAGTFGPTGTNQKHLASRFFYRTLSAGSYTWELRFRSETSGINASVWDATIAVWRVQ